MCRITRRIFFSYSHADLDLVRRLHAEVAGLLRGPLARSRLKILRDETVLAPGPDLPNRIQTMIQQADWLVVLLSERSGRSPWVEKEIDFWLCRDDRADRLLLVSLEEGLRWEFGTGLVADWLSPEIGSKFATEPMFIPLATGRAGTEAEVHAVAVRIAAAVLEKSPEEVESEERRLRRRAMRAAIATAAVLALLTVAASTAGVLAFRAQRSARADAAASLSAYLGSQALLEAPRRPDLAAELAAAEWHVNPSNDAWSQLLELASFVPTEFSAVRVPISHLDRLDRHLSPDGTRIALVGNQPGDPRGTEPARVVIARLDGAAAPTVFEGQPDLGPDVVTWLSDTRLLVLNYNGNEPGGRFVVDLIDANGQVLTRQDMPTASGGNVVAADPSHFFAVDDQDTPRLYRVSAAGDFTLEQTIRLPDDFGHSYDVSIYADPETGRYWVMGDSPYDLLEGSVGGANPEPWIGDRSTNIPVGFGRLPWSMGPRSFVWATTGTEESSRRGGSVVVLNRSDDDVQATDSVPVGDSVSGLCVTEVASDGTVDRYLASAAPDERLLQVAIVDNRVFDTMKTHRLTRVEDVACSADGAAAWVTGDGLVLSTQGQLTGETGGLTWLRIPDAMDAELRGIGPVNGVPGPLEAFRSSDLRIDESSVRLVRAEDDDVLAVSYLPSGGSMAPPSAATRRVSSCLSVTDAEDYADGRPLHALVGDEIRPGVFRGTCSDWEVNGSGLDSVTDRELRLLHNGHDVGLRGVRSVVVDVESALVVVDTLEGLGVYSIEGGELSLVSIRSERTVVLRDALLTYDGGYLATHLNYAEPGSDVAGASFEAMPIGPDAIVGALCASYGSGPLEQYTSSSDFRGPAERVNAAGCR